MYITISTNNWKDSNPTGSVVATYSSSKWKKQTTDQVYQEINRTNLTQSHVASRVDARVDMISSHQPQSSRFMYRSATDRRDRFFDSKTIWNWKWEAKIEERTAWVDLEEHDEIWRRVGLGSYPFGKGGFRWSCRRGRTRRRGRRGGPCTAAPAAVDRWWWRPVAWPHHDWESARDGERTWEWQTVV